MEMNIKKITKEFYKRNFNHNLSVKLNNFKLYNQVTDKKGKILLIGCSYNWQYFENAFLDTTFLDINEITGPKKFIKQSITEKTPFENEEFDFILAPNVLDYVMDDIGALKEIFRILKDEGTLILQIYCFKDKTNKPMRVYSPLTIIDILKIAKFMPEKSFLWGTISFLFKVRVFKILILIIDKYFIKDIQVWEKIDEILSRFGGVRLIKYLFDGGVTLVCKKNYSLRFKHY